jgi:hypothetical protein
MASVYVSIDRVSELVVGGNASGLIGVSFFFAAVFCFRNGRLLLLLAVGLNSPSHPSARKPASESSVRGGEAVEKEDARPVFALAATIVCRKSPT